MADSLDAILGIVEAEPVTVVSTVVEQAAAIIEAETIAPTETPASTSVAVVPAAETPDAQEAELNADMAHVRANMKQIIASGQSALQSAIELAEEEYSPRAFEVIGGLITSITQANKELITIHKVRKDALKADKETKAVEQPASTINIDKVFVGRAQDLLRTLKDVERDLQGQLDDHA